MIDMIQKANSPPSFLENLENCLFKLHEDILKLIIEYLTVWNQEKEGKYYNSFFIGKYYNSEVDLLFSLPPLLSPPVQKPDFTKKIIIDFSFHDNYLINKRKKFHQGQRLHNTKRFKKHLS